MRTRRQKALLKEHEERIAVSMRKLVSSGRKLSETDDTGQTPENLAGDFSSADLIRHRITEPEVFDTPDSGSVENTEMQTPTSVRVAAISHGELTSTWTVNIEPSGILRPTATQPRPPGGRGRGNLAEQTVGRVESVTEEGCANPQLTSTPNRDT